MNNKTIEQKLKEYPAGWTKFVILIVFIVAMIFLGKITLDFNEVSEIGFRIIKGILSGLVKPSKALLFDFSENGLVAMLFETFAIGLLGTIFGAILSIPLAFLCSPSTAPRWLNVIILAIITIIRSFPTVMLAIMFVKTVGSGPFAGVLTMTIGSTGMITKMMVESIEDLDRGVLESLDASGCDNFTKIRVGIIPQLAAGLISHILYRLDINVKNASVLGMVGAGGIGATLLLGIEYEQWSNCGTVILGLIILVLIIELISTKIRKNLSNKD